MGAFRFLTILAVAAALLWETRPAYGLAYLGVSLFYVLHKLQGKAAQKLVVQSGSGEHFLFPGDQGQVHFTVLNPTRFAFAWVSALEKIPASLVTGAKQYKAVFQLGPRSQEVVTFQLTARQRGIYRLGPVELSVGDFLGIGTWKVDAPDLQTLIVYPQIYRLEQLSLPSQLAFGSAESQQINPDHTKLAGVRSYQEGDPLRTIHWPATARGQGLRVKQFEHTAVRPSAVFLNFCKADYEVSNYYVATETAVETAASLAAHLIRRGEDCGLFANAVLMEHFPETAGSALGQGEIRIPGRQGNAQLTRILTILAGIRTQNKIDFSSLLRRHGPRLEWGTILLWVIPQDTPELISQARSFVGKGRRVQIFVVGKVLHPELLRQPAGAALRLFQIAKERAVGLG